MPSFFARPGLGRDVDGRGPGRRRPARLPAPGAGRRRSAARPRRAAPRAASWPAPSRRAAGAAHQCRVAGLASRRGVRLSKRQEALQQNRCRSARPGSSGSSRMRRCSGMVVLMPSTTITSSERLMRAIASARVRPVRHELGDHGVVVRRDLVARRRRGCRRARPGRPGMRSRSRARGGREVPVGVLGVDAALDGVPLRSGSSSCPNESRSPAATRICSLTRSTPVTTSVTGCSTWMRVFISMK